MCLELQTQVSHLWYALTSVEEKLDEILLVQLSHAVVDPTNTHTLEEWMRKRSMNGWRGGWCFLTRDSDGPCGEYTSGRRGSGELWVACRFHSDCTPSSPRSPENRTDKIQTINDIQSKCTYVLSFPLFTKHAWFCDRGRLRIKANWFC